MGPDVTELCVSDNSNGDSISDTDDAANGSLENAENNDHTLKDTVTAECEAEKVIENEVPKSSESVSAFVVNWNSLCSDHADGTEKNVPAVEVLRKSVDSHSPDPVKKLEPHFHTEARKLATKSHRDEEDNLSLASSNTATSAKITVPVAPRLSCVRRLERRKEFYTKLEEKHKALEKEKHDFQARIKEEEQAAVKLLRKNMSYKANPVPGFYREGPPAKVELKKLPVTRPKSPNLTRRKSCGDEAPKLPSRHSMEAKASPLSSKSKVENGSNRVRSHPRKKDQREGGNIEQ